MRNPLTALILVVGCFAELPALAAPQETTTSEAAAAKPRSAEDAGDLAPPMPNPLLPSWNMVARVTAPLIYPPNASPATGASSVLAGPDPRFFLDYNLVWGWRLTNSPFITARREGSAVPDNAANPALVPDWQLRPQIAFLFSD